MNYDLIIQSTQAKLGSAPRTFHLWDKLSWYKQDKPDWDWWNEDLKHSVENWERVFIHGQLTWGRIIQVNTLLFQPGKDNCPGEVLIWLEKEKPFDAEAFDLIGSKLYEIKGYSEHFDPLDEREEKAFAAYLEDQMMRVYGLKVPPRIADGLHVRVSTAFFQRRHIPNGVISHLLFPVLYLEQDPMVVAMVPYKFWPKELLQQW